MDSFVPLTPCTPIEPPNLSLDVPSKTGGNSLGWEHIEPPSTPQKPISPFRRTRIFGLPHFRRNQTGGSELVKEDGQRKRTSKSPQGVHVSQEDSGGGGVKDIKVENSQQTLAPPPTSENTDFYSFRTEGSGLKGSQTLWCTVAHHGYRTDFYEVQRIGNGAFGKVSIVERKFDGQRFAVKQVCIALCGSRARARKLNEVRAMGLACRGPHIVRLHHTWAEGDPPQQNMFILMELCPNGNLERRSRLYVPPHELEVLDILGQITLALYACHSQLIAHGDLKLENIFYDEKNRLKLGDFGHAVFLDTETKLPTSYRHYEMSQNQPHIWSTKENVESCSQDEGDARYIALDMLNERTQHMSGDIFSLGMCMYELMMGLPLPRNGEEHTALRTTDVVRKNLRLTGRYTPEVTDFVFSLVHPNPAQRPNVQEVMHSKLFISRKARLDSKGNKDQVVDSLIRLSFLQTVNELEFYLLDAKRQELRQEKLLPARSTEAVEPLENDGLRRKPIESGKLDASPDFFHAEKPRPTMAVAIDQFEFNLDANEDVEVEKFYESTLKKKEKSATFFS